MERRCLFPALVRQHSCCLPLGLSPGIACVFKVLEGNKAAERNCCFCY